MELHTQTPHESRICPIDFRVKRSRSECIDNWKKQGSVKWFQRITALSLQLLSWNFTLRLPLSQEYALYIFWRQKVKDQGHNALITKNSLWCTIDIPIHLSSWNCIHRLPMTWTCALFILGSKGQGQNALITKNGNSRIIAFPLHLSSWIFIQRLPMRWGDALFIFGSKGQRSSSQCIDY